MNQLSVGENTVQRIDLRARSEDADAVLCSFYWSDEHGLACSAPEWLEELEATGIATQAGIVRPNEGRRFFDALQILSLSVVEVTEPRRVPVSEAADCDRLWG